MLRPSSPTRFLNGQSTLPIGFGLNGLPAVVNLPWNGILVPPVA
jgi:hypothetical protein